MGYTVSANAGTLEEQWYVVDAKDRILGRLATEIAYVLRGKHLPTYTPHAQMKTHVIVLNADKVRLTGDKWISKVYQRHTNYPGGLKESTPEKINAKKPGHIVWMAVQGMLPKNSLGRETLTHLRIFTGDDHPHVSQKPQPFPQRTVRSTAKAAA